MGEHPRVLVMATPMTLREEKFHHLMEQHRTEAEILSLPCPGLVEFVERGELDGAELEQFLKELFRAYRSDPVDGVVLGCTHYPLVKEMIQNALGENVKVFDGGAGTARETRRRLQEKNLLKPEKTKGNVKFENSLGTPEILELSRYLLVHKPNPKKI